MLSRAHTLSLLTGTATAEFSDNLHHLEYLAVADTHVQLGSDMISLDLGFYCVFGVFHGPTGHELRRYEITTAD